MQLKRISYALNISIYKQVAGCRVFDLAACPDWRTHPLGPLGGHSGLPKNHYTYLDACWTPLNRPERVMCDSRPMFGAKMTSRKKGNIIQTQYVYDSGACHNIYFRWSVP